MLILRASLWQNKHLAKDLLNDYQKPIKVVALKTVWYVVLGILFGVAFLYAMHGDQQALNAGLIH